MSKRILGVVPARGGSKGVPNKNIKALNGKPLIAYTIEAGLRSVLMTDMIVSTDSEMIKLVAESFGGRVPFLRPPGLSHDRSLAIPTIQHAVSTYEKIVGFTYDYIIMLQPTAPLRLAEDIDKSLEQLISSDADSIISVVDVGNYHPFKMKTIEDGFLKDYLNTGFENPPRQELPPVYIVNGAIYATKRDILMNENSFKGGSCIPYIMSPERSANIDTITDFIVAEYHLNQINNY
jgi:CMP-N-acetylneuraminic acid synthetase